MMQNMGFEVVTQRNEAEAAWVTSLLADKSAAVEVARISVAVIAALGGAALESYHKCVSGLAEAAQVKQQETM